MSSRGKSILSKAVAPYLFNKWAEANGYPMRMGKAISQKRKDYVLDGDCPNKGGNVDRIMVNISKEQAERLKREGDKPHPLVEESQILGQTYHFISIDESHLLTPKWKTIMEEHSGKTNEHINIQAEDGRVEIIHRYGQAPKVQDPQVVSLAGSIEAPLEYYLKRRDVIDQDKAHLEVNQEKGHIYLYCDPSSPVGTSVQGKLLMNPMLQSLYINAYGKAPVDEDEFILMLKRARPIFDSQSENMNLVDKIKNLSVKVERQVDNRDDERGSMKQYYEQVCESDLPAGFTLTTNIFVASKDATVTHTFDVELKYHYKGGLLFWLESPELQEIADQVREEMLGEQIMGFNEEIPIIYL